MKNDKMDARSRFTRHIIKTSLIKLLNDKPIKNVTVAELCREANITRGTFYNHFYDVYDVRETVENEFFDSIAEKFAGVKTYALDGEFLLEIMRLLDANVEITQMILAEPDESGLLKRLISFVHEKYVMDFSEKFPALDRSVVETLYMYSSSGSVAVVLDWLKNGKPVPAERMAALIGEFNKIILAGCASLQRLFD